MDFNSQPIWAGVALLFPDDRIATWQMSHPQARISVERQFKKFGAWNTGFAQFIPTESTIDVHLKGDAAYWNAGPDVANEHRRGFMLRVPNLRAIEGGPGES